MAETARRYDQIDDRKATIAKLRQRKVPVINELANRFVMSLLPDRKHDDVNRYRQRPSGVRVSDDIEHGIVDASHPQASGLCKGVTPKQQPSQMCGCLQSSDDTHSANEGHSLSSLHENQTYSGDVSCFPTRVGAHW